MRKSYSVLLLLVIILLAQPAQGQTRVYTNKDPQTGVVVRNIVWGNVVPTGPVVPVPESLLRGQYVHYPKYINMRLLDAPVPPYEPPPSPQLLAPKVPYVQQYYGDFVPLTPDGPLINSAVLSHGKRR